MLRWSGTRARQPKSPLNAVDEQRLRAAANQVFGAGDIVCAADEWKGHCHGVGVCPMAWGVN